MSRGHGHARRLGRRPDKRRWAGRAGCATASGAKPRGSASMSRRPPDPKRCSGHRRTVLPRCRPSPAALQVPPVKRSRRRPRPIAAPPGRACRRSARRDLVARGVDPLTHTAGANAAARGPRRERRRSAAPAAAHSAVRPLVSAAGRFTPEAGAGAEVPPISDSPHGFGTRAVER